MTRISCLLVLLSLAFVPAVLGATNIGEGSSCGGPGDVCEAGLKCFTPGSVCVRETADSGVRCSPTECCRSGLACHERLADGENEGLCGPNNDFAGLSPLIRCVATGAPPAGTPDAPVVPVPVPVVPVTSVDADGNTVVVLNNADGTRTTTVVRPDGTLVSSSTVDAQGNPVYADGRGNGVAALSSSFAVLAVLAVASLVAIIA